MRPSQRENLFPPIREAPPAHYRERFRQFPVWYRWYLRLRTLFTAETVESITRKHYLHQSRRRLAITAKTILDPSIPALIGGFHAHVRDLQEQLKTLSPALNEATGHARGSFLRLVLAEKDPTLHATIQQHLHLTEEEQENPYLTLDQLQSAVARRVEEHLTKNTTRVTSVLEPIWTALRGLNVLTRVDLDSLLPVQGSRRAETPLRVVKAPLATLYQAIELAHRHQSLDATELSFSFARPRVRKVSASSRRIWATINALWKETPLLEICRYAADDPLAEIPPIKLKTDWWHPLLRSWIDTGQSRCGSELLEHRHSRLLEMIQSNFEVEDPPAGWIPTVLNPRVTGALQLLAGSELFHDTRRSITQLVIDATFFHMDTRNTLHQMAQQIDQGLEEITERVGLGSDRGTLGEEIIRLQQRSGPTSIIHRQLTTVYERHRPRLRSATEECIAALKTAGTIIENNLAGGSTDFEVTEFHHTSYAGDYSTEQLLRIVASHWRPVGEILEGLYTLETRLSSYQSGYRGTR